MSNKRETVLEVQGMTCAACVRHVSDALGALDGVERVEVELRDGIVVVRHDSARAPVNRLIDALGEAGYEAQSGPASE